MNDKGRMDVRVDLAGLGRLAKPVPKPEFVGSWATIELQPDLFAPQRFTVGVAVQSEGDRLHFKLLDDFKRFECVYADDLPRGVLRALMACAYEALGVSAKARTPLADIRFASECLSMSSAAFTSGSDREATVERLFAEVVVMARPPVKGRGSFETIDTAAARRLVNKHLKLVAGLDFERFVQEENYGMLIQAEDSAKHFLDLNLLTPRGCGSVCSAVYKSAQTVEVNLLNASLDLKTCRLQRNLAEVGLFVLMPEASAMDRKEFRRIAEVIGDHEWKLEQDGFRVTSLNDAEALARDVYDWARPSLG